MTPIEDTLLHAPSAFRIAVPLDGSDLAAQALPVARDLCRNLDAELVLVRVVSPMVGSPLAGPYAGAVGYDSTAAYQQLQEDMERESRDYLEQTAAGIKADGIAVSSRLGVGTPVEGLTQILSSLHPNLVVMTTHGLTGLARVVMGSVADHVVRSGVAPVLLLRSSTAPAPSGTQQRVELSHALMPLDGTELAATPLFRIGLRLAGPVLREITLLRVVDPKDGVAEWTVAEEYLDTVRQRVVDRLQEQGRECAVSPLVRWGGDPAAAIVECAQTEGCDLVLMATHSAAGIGRVVFGDVTDRVLRDGKTPLLLVHPPQS